MSNVEKKADNQHNNQTKQQIISVAQELFQKHRFESVTISQICELVEISKHTFYYYFKSKAELLVICSGTERSISKSELTEILLSEDNFFEQFWKLQKPKIDFAIRCGSEILKNIQHIINENRAENTSYNDEQREIESSIIKKAQKAGEVRNMNSADSLVLASRVYQLGILTLWVSMDGSFDLEKTFRAGVEVFFDVRPDLCRGEGLHSLLHKDKGPTQ